MRDPTLRFTDAGKILLRSLTIYALDAESRERMIEAVPAHHRQTVVNLANAYGAPGRLLAGELIKENPHASLREIARAAGQGNAEIVELLSERGLHPYGLHVASENVRWCASCQSYLCGRACKNHAGNICVEPAVRDHNARILDRATAVRLEATRTKGPRYRAWPKPCATTAMRL